MRIGKFFIAIGHDWLAKMSGPLTVPFTIAAFFVSPATYRGMFAGLAILAAMITSYRVWAHENENFENANAKVRAYEDRAKAIIWISHFADEGSVLAVNAPNEDATRMEIVRWRQSIEGWRNTTTDALLSLSVVAKDKFFDFDAGREAHESIYAGKHRDVASDLVLLEEKRRNLREIMEKADVYLVKVI
jgi:hypothetical protein